MTDQEDTGVAAAPPGHPAELEPISVVSALRASVPNARYARNPDYGKLPRWGRLYERHFPLHTCPASRHAKIIAKDILRDPRSPVRQLLIDAGYEPDHWASSLESTVTSLWDARERLRKADPIGEKRRQDRQLKRAMKRTAQAIEARRAETTEIGSVEDESAVAASDAPNGDSQ